jgi:hypothetical protein
MTKELGLDSGVIDFSLLQNIWTSSRAHPASNSMGTGGSYNRGKVAWADHSPVPNVGDKRLYGLISPFPHMSSRSKVQVYLHLYTEHYHSYCTSQTKKNT